MNIKLTVGGVVLLWFVACSGPVQMYEVLEQLPGSALTAQMNSEIFRVSRSSDLPNAFGKADVLGDHPNRTDCLELVSELPLLAIEPAVAETVEAYIAHKLMPRDPGGDALHLALASHYRCDFLATWNCRHLANANKFDHVRRINGILGLFVPALVTPLELLGENDG